MLEEAAKVDDREKNLDKNISLSQSIGIQQEQQQQQRKVVIFTDSIASSSEKESTITEIGNDGKGEEEKNVGKQQDNVDGLKNDEERTGDNKKQDRNGEQDEDDEEGEEEEDGEEESESMGGGEEEIQSTSSHPSVPGNGKTGRLNQNSSEEDGTGDWTPEIPFRDVSYDINLVFVSIVQS